MIADTSLFVHNLLDAYKELCPPTCLDIRGLKLRPLNRLHNIACMETRKGISAFLLFMYLKLC